MNKAILMVLVLVGAGLFSGCTKGNSATDTTSGNQIEQKVGDTTKTGAISEAGGRYFLTEAGGTPKEIESYTVELSSYVGQTITVVGQYSGDTLFVGEVK